MVLRPSKTTKDLPSSRKDFSAFWRWIRSGVTSTGCSNCSPNSKDSYQTEGISFNRIHKLETANITFSPKASQKTEIWEQQPQRTRTIRDISPISGLHKSVQSSVQQQDNVCGQSKHQCADTASTSFDTAILKTPTCAKNSASPRWEPGSVQTSSPRSNANFGVVYTGVKKQDRMMNSIASKSGLRTAASPDLRQRGRSRSRIHETLKHASRTPSPLPELDGKSIDSPITPNCGRGTLIAELDSQQKKTYHLADHFASGDCKKSKCSPRFDLQAMEPIIFDENKHDPEDFYNPNFSPIGSSLSRHCPDIKLQDILYDSSMHLSPPTFKLPATCRVRPVSAHTKSIYELPASRVDSLQLSGYAPNLRQNVDTVHELSVHHSGEVSYLETSPSAKSCASYERLRPAPLRPRAHTDSPSLTITPITTVSRSAKGHARSPSSYSYTPTKDTRAGRKSFNTIRFVDSSGTSHEKLIRVLGI